MAGGSTPACFQLRGRLRGRCRHGLARPASTTIRRPSGLAPASLHWLACAGNSGRRGRPSSRVAPDAVASRSSAGWNHTLTRDGLVFHHGAPLAFSRSLRPCHATTAHQGAVGDYGWLSRPRWSATGLGEATPGHSIMVVASPFCSGAYGRGRLRPENLFPAAPSGGAGHPGSPSAVLRVPSWQASCWSKAPAATSIHRPTPAAAITAAVVGVIPQSGALFRLPCPVARPGWLEPFDRIAAVLILPPLLALFRWRWSVMQVIGAAALTGIAFIQDSPPPPEIGQTVDASVRTPALLQRRRQGWFGPRRRWRQVVGGPEALGVERL